MFTTKNYPKVAIVTLNWNGSRHLRYFLRSVSRLHYPNFFTVVVDNGSSDDSVDFVSSEYPEYIIIENGANIGYSKGFNKGIEYAIENGAEYILITNNDVILDSEILVNGVNIFEKGKRIGYVAGKVYELNTQKRFQYAGGRSPQEHPSSHPVTSSRGVGEIDIGQYEKIEDFEFMDDVCSMVSTYMIKEVGSYDEDFFFDYEETEWNVRIRKKGFRIVYNPSMKVWHRNHGSTGGNRLSKFPEYYSWRGKILFFYKTQPSTHFLFTIIFSFFVFLPIRFSILSVKYNKPLLFISTVQGVISSLKRVIEIKH